MATGAGFYPLHQGDWGLDFPFWPHYIDFDWPVSSQGSWPVAAYKAVGKASGKTAGPPATNRGKSCRVSRWPTRIARSVSHFAAREPGRCLGAARKPCARCLPVAS